MINFPAAFAALSKLDAIACEKAIGQDGLVDPTTARRFLLAIRQSGCLLLKLPNKDREVKRDQFATWLKSTFSVTIESQIKADFENHLNDARLIESYFRQILLSLEKSKIWQLDPSIQAWGILQRGIADSRHLQEKMDEVIANWNPEDGRPFDPAQVKLEGENGIPIDPGHASNGIVQSVATTLFLLAHKNKWFDPQTGEIVLPDELPIDERTTFKSGTHTLLSLQWLHLERAWDRARFFQTHVKIQTLDEKSGAPKGKIIKALTSTSPDSREILDHIALTRLERIVYEQTSGAIRSGAPRFTKIKSDTVLALPPTKYLSLSEEVATYVLMEVYCVPVDDETQLFADLPLKVWIRGYAFYEHLATTDKERPVFECLNFTLSQLTTYLVAIGMTADQASKFIRLTTFQKFSLDLYDTPLLRIKDESFRFFSPAFHSPQIAGIVLSRIGSLNRVRDSNGIPAEPIQFLDKGHQFEQRVLDLFVKAGIPARSFHYKIDGIRYDCDVAVFLDNTLFIFECKNYNLPHGRISELSHLIDSLSDFQKQVARIADQLSQHPEILRDQFGAEFKCTKIVPCVLQALPWSMGQVGEVYFYDQSALIRFIKEGIIKFHNITSDTAKQVTSRHAIKLRSAKVPTEAEMLKELANPIQLRLHTKGWDISRIVVSIGDEHALALPEWRQHSLSLEEQCKALGFEDTQIKEIIEDLAFEPPSMLKKAINIFHTPSSTSKQNRNDPCQCGSGVKYKKCCGKV